MALQIVHHDITKIEVDAIVNSTNEHFEVGGLGVDASIHYAAGPELAKALHEIGYCPEGSAVITKSFGIETCRYIIHTVGPIYQGGFSGERKLLMSCYLHDIGMAISEKQYEDALKEIPFGDYFQKNPDAEKERVVRDFHQEFSAAFVRRYARMLEIPSAEHEFAIIEVCRGHRRTDLFDVSQFPPHYTVPGGNEIPLPYLAALIRLADEIDVVAARNPIMLYDIESFTDAEEIAYHKQHEAVKELIIEEDAFILHAVHTDEDIERMIAGTRDKMEKTLLYCREAARKQSSFRITQKEVRILYLD